MNVRSGESLNVSNDATGTPQIHIRRMDEGDLPQAMRLKERAEWNQTVDDWRVFLRGNPEGCFVAMLDEAVVGTVATIRYGPRVAWLSMMLVDPDRRRRGIGTRLMHAALEHLRDCPCVRLDATPAGKMVYDRMGFRDEYGLARLSCAGLPAVEAPTADAERIAPHDMDEVAALDREAFGADRRAVLDACLRSAPELAWKLVRGGRMAGFCLGRRGVRYYQVGPVIAESFPDAALVAGAALGELAGRPAVVDAADAQGEFRRWLCAHGFQVQRPLTRMCLGDAATLPPADGKTFAVAGPEFG